jgi:hypothetical protein
MNSQNKIEISYYIYILMIVFVFLISINVNAQSFIKQEISIVEFNTNWNIDNHFKGFNELKNCKTYSISLCDNPNYKEKFKIKYPAIVVYNKGNEIKRYNTNILFGFDVTYKNLQIDVDSLLLSKFN